MVLGNGIPLRAIWEITQTFRTIFLHDGAKRALEKKFPGHCRAISQNRPNRETIYTKLWGNFFANIAISSDSVICKHHITLILPDDFHCNLFTSWTFPQKTGIVGLMFYFYKGAIHIWTITAQTGLQPFRRQMTHFLTDMSNRVEHQKLNQTTA